MAPHTSFFAWLFDTQLVRMIVIHAVLFAVLTSLYTDQPAPPWDLITWTISCGILGLWWCANYWYWFVRLEQGTK